MKRRYFIAGNQFYDFEEEAIQDLMHMIELYGIPERAFTIVGLDTDDDMPTTQEKILN